MFNWGPAVKKEKEEDAVMQPEEKKHKPKAKPKAKKKKSAKKPPIADISSGEEEKRAKSSKRAKQPKRSRQPPTVDELAGAMLLVDATGFPEIRDLGKLINDNPHMCGDITKPDRCIGTKPEGKEEKQDAEPSPKENPSTKPLEQIECQRRLDEMPVVHPVIVDGQTWRESDKVRLLRQNKYFLPLMRASLESELLAASGTWKHGSGRVYEFPRCKRGDKCVGMDGNITFVASDSSNGKPFKYVLTSFMLPTEYEKFLVDGRAPQTRQPCVACLRVMLVDAVCAFRGGKAFLGDSKEVTELTPAEDLLLQPYRNLIDCEEGYHREFCLEPNDECWEGVISPIATYRASLLVARKGRYNRPYIDQSAMIWKAGVAGKPALGESISNFSTGASS